MSEKTNTQDQPTESFDVHEFDASLRLKDVKKKIAREIERGRNPDADSSHADDLLTTEAYERSLLHDAFVIEAYENCLKHIEVLENKGHKSTLICKAVVRNAGSELSKLAKGIHEFSRSRDLADFGTHYTGYVAVRDEYVRKLNAWAHVLDQLNI